MTITDTTLIGDIAARVPSSVRVFQRHGVDFCCGGRRTLADACEEQGLSPEDLAREIHQSATAPAAEERDWTNVSLAELSEHIVRTYHEPLREELPRIAQMAARVAEVHRARGGAVLERIHAIADDLAEDLIEHMKKEERILFPAIR